MGSRSDSKRARRCGQARSVVAGRRLPSTLSAGRWRVWFGPLWIVVAWLLTGHYACANPFGVWAGLKSGNYDDECSDEGK